MLAVKLHDKNIMYNIVDIVLGINIWKYLYMLCTKDFDCMLRKVYLLRDEFLIIDFTIIINHKYVQSNMNYPFVNWPIGRMT